MAKPHRKTLYPEITPSEMVIFQGAVPVYSGPLYKSGLPVIHTLTPNAARCNVKAIIRTDSTTTTSYNGRGGNPLVKILKQAFIAPKEKETVIKEVAQRVARGEPITKIFAINRHAKTKSDVHLPSYLTFRSWIRNNPEYEDLFQAAREIHAEQIVAKATKAIEREDLLPADKTVRAAHYRWLASKENPDRFGDRQQIDITNRVEKMSDDELERRVNELTRLLKGGVTVEGEVVPPDPT